MDDNVSLRKSHFVYPKQKWCLALYPMKGPSQHHRPYQVRFYVDGTKNMRQPKQRGQSAIMFVFVPSLVLPRTLYHVRVRYGQARGELRFRLVRWEPPITLYSVAKAL